MAEGVPARCPISLFLGELSGGGAERVMVTLANGFAKRGQAVDLVLATLRGPYLADVEPTVRIVDLGAGSTSRALPGLVRYLRSERPRVMLTTLHHTAIAVLLAKRLARSPVEVYLREANDLRAMRPATVTGRLLVRGVEFAYRAADGAIAVSDGVAEGLAHRVPAVAGRITTIYNPVVGPDLLERSRCPVEHRWFGDGSRVVLAAGRLNRQKDFSTLIRAFRMLDDADLKLLILGEGEERPKLEELVEASGLSERVELPGFVSNPFAYMAGASLFVLSSRWEGMPGVLIQAMACGCPVVSTDCPSGPAEVLCGGRFGELVPVGDVLALARAMKRRLSEPVDTRGLIQRASDFSEDASIDAYLALLLDGQPFRRVDDPPSLRGATG